MIIQYGFTLFVIFGTWIMPVEGWLIDRMGPRIFLTIAGVLCGIGWSSLAYVTSIPQLYLFYSIAGVGAAFVYSGSIGTALKWFPDKRGLASGLIAAGFGAGSALFIPVIRYLIDTQSYQQAFLYTGVVQGIIIIVAAQFLRYPSHGPERRRSRRPAPIRESVRTRISSRRGRCCARRISTCCTPCS